LKIKKENDLKIKRGLKPGIFLIMIIILLMTLSILNGCSKILPNSKDIVGSDNQASTSVSEKLDDFTLNDLQGNEISLSDFTGKIIVLNFWATWCPPCKAEIPDFVETYNEFKNQDVVFLGVSIDDDINALEQFVSEYHIDYPVLIDNLTENVSASWNISAIPTTFFINTDGKIIDKWVGQIPKQQLVSILNELINDI
jgi:peroxiredoxin